MGILSVSAFQRSQRIYLLLQFRYFVAIYIYLKKKQPIYYSAFVLPKSDFQFRIFVFVSVVPPVVFNYLQIQAGNFGFVCSPAVRRYENNRL